MRQNRLLNYVRPPMSSVFPHFERLARTVDLNDPSEMALAHKFMIEALYRVNEQLPSVAQEAAAVANSFSTGVANDRDLERERVRLWTSIAGRDMSDESDVLRIRTALCVLYAPDPAQTKDTVECFLEFWHRAGLDITRLEAAIVNSYGGCSYATANSAGPV